MKDREHRVLFLFKGMHESESESRSVVSDSIQSMEFSRPEYWSGQSFPSPGDLPNPGIEPRSPALQVDSLPAEPPGKPKNTGVSSLSLLQGIFLIQGSNPGLPHCRWVLYRLGHRESPKGCRPSCISGVFVFLIISLTASGLSHSDSLHHVG